MNYIEEVLVKTIVKSSELFFDADKWVKKKTGKGIIDRMEESEEKDKALREKNYALWAVKKLTIGTIKGLTGSALSH